MEPAVGITACVVAFAVLALAGWLLGRAWGLAPGTAMVAATPVGFGFVALVAGTQTITGQSFGWWEVAVAWGVVAVLGMAVRVARELVVRRRPAADAAPRRRRHHDLPIEFGLLLLGVTLLSAIVFVIAGGGTLETSSQTWDAMIHQNSVRALVDLGVGSPFHVHDFAVAGGVGGYYPSGFTAVTALVMSGLHSDAVFASNVTAVLAVGALWPSAVMVMVRLVLTSASWVVGLSGLLSLGFWGMPWAPVGYGVLWPTLGAAAFVPIAVGALASLLGLARGIRLGPVHAAALLLASLLAVGLFHPRGLALAAPVLGVVWLAGMAKLAGGRARPPWVRGLGVAGALLLVAAAIAAVTTVTFSRVAIQQVPVTSSVGGALLGHLVAGVNHSLRQWHIAVLLVVGLVTLTRSRERRWIPVCYLVLVLLDVATATQRGALVQSVTAFWYGNQWRSAVMAPALGMLVVTAGAQAAVSEALRVFSSGRRRRRYRRLLRPVAVVLAVALPVASLPSAASYLSSTYIEVSRDPQRSLVSPQEITFFQRVAAIVPHDARLLNNAADGSSLLYAYTGVKPVFLFGGSTGSTRFGSALQRTLVTETNHTRICNYLFTDKIRWVLTMGRTFNDGTIVQTPAPGIEIPPSFWATTLVLQEGDAKLYRITGCPGL